MSDTTLKALVVDDDQNLRRIICHILQSAGHETLEGRNGQEALKIAREQRPDVILMDVMMPIVDGFTACRELKSGLTTKDIPIIMCTARSSKEDMILAIRAAANDYIVKPFSRETLLQKVAKVTGAVAVGTRPAAQTSERRAAPRAPVQWSLSWGKGEDSCMKPVFKAEVVDISPRGFSFIFARCAQCTGYRQGTVHQECLFTGHAIRRHDAPPLDFILSVSPDLVIEAQGRIAHVYQPPSDPSMERVGVTFTKISDEARRTLIKSISQSSRPSRPVTDKKELQTNGVNLQ